jgi:UDP-4-amino-4-deoxy-L-arabinose-oxoglutarate aminotransferase
MRSEFLPFSKPAISEEEIAAVAEVLRSGWITTGPRVSDFERLFSKYVGCKGAVAVSSATAGMHILLRALNIAPGDEVVTPSMTWVSTVNLIVLAGAVPVFADIDRDTLMVTADSIRRCVTSRTRLIVPVHFAGAPLDMEPIRSLSEGNGISVVEDAAHAPGAEYKGLRVGGTGTSVFSFHPIKNITTGEGGMVCSDDPALLERLRRLKFHGFGQDAYNRQMQGRAPQAQVLEPGYKYNMTDISAAMGICQLRRLDELNRKREELAMIYRERLSGVEEILPLRDPPYPFRHAWHLFIVRLDIDNTGLTRDEFMDMLKKRNIGTGLHFRAVHRHLYYRKIFSNRHDRLPHTDWNSERICSLPLFPAMTAGDVEDVVEAIKEVLKR